MATIMKGYNITHNRLAAQSIADQRARDAQEKGYVLTGYEPYTLRSNQKGGGWNDQPFDMPIYGMDPAVAAAEAARKQQEYAAQLQSAADASTEANKKQLLQIQSERSAVSKMTEDYTAMLQKEADARAAAQEKARVSAATSAANQARQGQAANLQIQPASSTPQTAGTQAFKRRKDQFKITKPAYSGLSISQSGMVNV